MQARKVLRVVWAVWVAEIINQAHFKAPGDGVDFPWHQDSVNRGYHTGKFLDVHGNRSYVNIAVAIDAETPDNGPLSVYEGKTLVASGLHSSKSASNIRAHRVAHAGPPAAGGGPSAGAV